MKKFKFNYKLTLFLVGLFVSFLFVFLGGKFNICYSFGLIGLGLSMWLYLYYYIDTVNKSLKELNRKIEYVENGFYPIENVVDEESIDNEELEKLNKEEQEYMSLELLLKRNTIVKNDKKIKFLFSLCGLAFVICGFIVIG